MNPIKATLAFLLATTPALADSIQYTTAFSNRVASTPLPGFDPGLGQLDEVEFTITGIAGGFWFTATPVTSGTFNLATTAMLDGSILGFGMDSHDFAYDPAATSLLVDTTCTLGATTRFDLDRFTVPTLSPSMTLSPFFTNLDPAASPRGSLTSYSGTETITYIYGVPEPSGIVMLVVAILVVNVAYVALRVRSRTRVRYRVASKPEVMAVVDRLMDQHDEALSKLAD